MPPRLRLAILAAAAAVLAVIMGLKVANESYFLGGIIFCGLLWLVAERLHGPLPDAWVLAALLVGYIVGNRGFAQLFLLPNFPLLPAEAGLLVCTPMLIFRMAFKQAAALRRDGLNLAILAWMLLGAARLPFDLHQYGFVALRDSAMVYYACFFFIAQAFCRHDASRSLLRRAMQFAFLLLPVVSVALSLAPEFFLTMFTWRGVPLIYHKGDLVATYLASGFFLFWAMRETGAHRAWLIPAAVCLLMSPTVGSPRAAMFSTAMVTIIWLLARRLRLLLFQVGVVTAGLATVLLVWVFHENKDLRETTAYSVYEHAISIVDFEGKGTYLHAETGDPGNNGQGGSVLPNIPGEFSFKLGGAGDLVVVDHPPGHDAGFVGALPVIAQPAAMAALTLDGRITAHPTFCPGVIGMARAQDADSANSQFFLMRQARDNLDEHYAAFGRVIVGEDVVRAIKVGEPPSDPQDRMTRVQMLADIPEGVRPSVKVVDTKSAYFADLVNNIRVKAGDDFSLCDVEIAGQAK